MWDILYIPDPQNAAKSWYLFTNQYIVPMRYINNYIKEIIKD